MEKCCKIKKMIENTELEVDLVTEIPSELQTHIDECEECADLIRDLKSVSGIIKNTERLTVSKSFDENLRAKIRVSMHHNDKDSAPFFTRAFYYAAGIAAVVVGFFYISSTGIIESPEQGNAFATGGVHISSVEGIEEPAEMKDSLHEMRRVVIDDEELRMRVAAE